MDRIIVRTIRALFSLGPIQAVLVWRLNRTYRYDNIREGIIGYDPARKCPAPRKAKLIAAAA